MSYSRILFGFLLCSLFLSTAEVRAEKSDTLITSLRALIGQTDSTTGLTTYTNADLRRYLTLAMAGIVGESLDKEADTTINGGSEGNAPPSDFLGFSGPAVLLRSNNYVKIIPAISPDSLYRMGVRPTVENMGQDNHVMFWAGNQIWILPAINANDSVVIPYYQRATVDMATGVEVDAAIEWEYVIVYNAAAICYARIQDWQAYDRMIAERDKKLTALRAVQTIKQKASPQVVP